MHYLVIDLEMCRVKKLYRKTYKYASEIIQIGAVLLDEGFNRIATICEYVNPEYGVLDNFIESMTGIKNRDTPLTISSTSWKLAPAVEKPVLVLM